MEEQETHEGTRTTPESLLRGFTAGRFGLWMLVAVAVHGIVIGITSLGYVRDRWIDPEGAAERKAAAAEAEMPKVSPPPAAVAAPSPAPVAAAAATGTNAAALLEARRDTPIVQAITSTPASNAIPRQPDDIGISISDTNVK